MKSSIDRPIETVLAELKVGAVFVERKRDGEEIYCYFSLDEHEEYISCEQTQKKSTTLTCEYYCIVTYN